MTCDHEAQIREAEAEAMNNAQDYDRRGERLWRLAALVGHEPGESDNDATAELVVRQALASHEAQIRDLLEEREELLTEIVRLRRGNHPAGRALPHLALAEALTERDAEHEGGGGA